MTLKSNSFAVLASSSAKADAKKNALLERHRKSVEKVVADAKSFSDDRKRKLSKITNLKLRESASR